MKRAAAIGAAALVAASLSACSGVGGEEGLTVMVAASMCSLAEQVENDLDFEVTTVCSGSADLVAQIEAGADADLLITANQSTADRITNGDRGAELSIVASNELVMVVPAGNPAGITGFDESINDVDLVVCAPQVPCGEVSLQAAEINSMTLSPVSEEQSVTDVLGKITSGQGDVGLVYRTDANRAGDAVEVVDIPNSDEVLNVYPLLVIDADEPDDREQQWIDAFTRGDGQDRLVELGFALP